VQRPITSTSLLEYAIVCEDGYVIALIGSKRRGAIRYGAVRDICR
jgi:hypothetical protein